MMRGQSRRPRHTGVVDIGYWGIAVVLVVGTLVVWYGWYSDRRRTRDEAERMTAPPDREIPGFHPDKVTPHYLSELQAVTRPDDAASTDLSEQDRTALTQALKDAPPIPAGWPRPEFVTHAPSKRAILDDPLILVCADPVETVRELLPAIEHAKLVTRPLVVVAPDIDDVVIDTLRANAVQRTLANLPLVLEDADARQAVADRTSATPVPRGDLQSGWLPENAYGTCARWVSDASRSWALTAGNG